MVARGVREIIEVEYFEHRTPPMEITDTRHTKEKLFTDYTCNCLQEKIQWHLQGARRKSYGGGLKHENGGVSKR